MTTKTESLHAGGYVVSEAQGMRSREVVTILSGQNLGAGRVIGKITASGKYRAHDADNTDGSQTAAGVLFGPVDATAGDTKGVAHVRDCEVNGAELDWGDNDAGQITAGKASLTAIKVIQR